MVQFWTWLFGVSTALLAPNWTVLSSGTDKEGTWWSFCLFLHKNIFCGYSLLMSTHNVCFYGELVKIILQLSPNTLFNLGHIKRFWYLSPMRAAKVQASLRICTVTPEPPLLAHSSSESRGTFRQKARSLAPLNGWACAVKICHDGMLEDTNSLEAAHLFFCLSQFINQYYCALALIAARRPVTAWNPDLILATLHREPQVSHCRKNNRSSFCSNVSGDLHVWQVTYSSVGEKKKICIRLQVLKTTKTWWEESYWVSGSYEYCMSFRHR